MIPLSIILIILLTVGCGTSQMYKTPEHERKIMEIYNSKLAQWTVEFDTINIKTKLGITHITASGEKENQPVILLHAMGLTSTMWLDNISELSKHFRVYAVDLLGDIGKSRLFDTGEYLDSDGKYSQWLSEICDSLKIEKADFVGASFGGWITISHAIFSHQRVNKIVLLGPMGLTSTSFKTIWRILSLVWFPTDSKKKDMLEWALGNNPRTISRFSEHMWLAMDCKGFMATPWAFDEEELQKIKARTLLLLGEKDDLIGSIEEVKSNAEKNIANVEIAIIEDAGHMINTDRPEITDSLITRFLKSN
ncbi:MAG: alpha/beta fold hydrolase [Ignavibacteriales bacterium]|nr:alpha/beta fold hydrolase [Ignavibacteriales bacterium]